MNSKSYQSLLAGWFPAVVLFFMLPFAIYLPNQGEFGYDLSITFPFVIAGAAWMICLVVARYLLPNAFERIALILFYVGLYIALADILAPVQTGVLGADALDYSPAEPLFNTIVEFALLIAVVVVAVKLPGPFVIRCVAPVVGFLCIFQVLYVDFSLSPRTELHWHRATFVAKQPAETRQGSQGSPSGNVYQICFDGYSAAVFKDALDDLGLAEQFDGFVCYENNRSNYIHTLGSLPSYLTGSFFPGGVFQDWDQHRIQGGLIGRLYDAGYTVSMYVPDASYFHENASLTKSRRDVIRGRIGPPEADDVYDLLDLWLLRIAPTFLHHELHDGRSGPFKRLASARAEAALTSGRGRENASHLIFDKIALAEDFIQYEEIRPARGQYVYAHLYVTHWPWSKRKRDCRYDPTGTSTYLDAAVCATSIMAQFTAKLKDLGRYRDATIIIQSDHGTGVMGPKVAAGASMTKEVADAISERTGFRPKVVENRTHALLLIKPPGRAGEPLVFSRAATQLADIPATVFHMLGMDAQTETGKSVLLVGEDERREIHMFAGFYHINKYGRMISAGKQIFEGKICHFSFTAPSTWKLYPDIPYSWDKNRALDLR